MEPICPESLSLLLMRYVSLSENGFAILDAHSVLLYHNAALADMLGFPGQSLAGRGFDEMMTAMFQSGSGPKIAAPTLQAWLDQVHSAHRSAPYRSFEVDLVDGRWLLLTEQLHPNGEVILQSADITAQKRVEAELKQAHFDLERLAMTDELTGVPNRRYFFQQLTAELVRTRRYRHPMCFAMLDLDHFKKVNDQHGHPAGDLVLRHFAGFVRAHLRSADVIGRLGGEEFAVLLPETAIDDALFVLRRIGQALAGERLDAVAPGFSYSFSGGVVALPAEAGADCQWLSASADRALYAAKNGGRNRVFAYAP